LTNHWSSCKYLGQNRTIPGLGLGPECLFQYRIRSDPEYQITFSLLLQAFGEVVVVAGELGTIVCARLLELGRIRRWRPSRKQALPIVHHIESLERRDYRRFQGQIEDDGPEPIDGSLDPFTPLLGPVFPFFLQPGFQYLDL